MQNRMIRIGDLRWIRAWDLKSIEVIDSTVRIVFDDVASTKGIVVVNYEGPATATARAEALAEEVNEAYKEAD